MDNSFGAFGDVSDSIKTIAEKFGFHDDGDKKNATYREFTEKRGYLAFINPDQEDRGPYNGLSFVVFPIGYKKHPNNNDSDSEFICVVAIGVGRDDVGSDEELASLPYLRRCFLKLTGGGTENYEKNIFIKSSFADTTTECVDLFRELDKIKSVNEKESDESTNNEPTFKVDLSVIEAYKKNLPAARIVKFKKRDCKKNDGSDLDIEYLSKEEQSDNHFKIIVSWLALYAKIRNWNYGRDRLKNKNTAIGFTEKNTKKELTTELSEIYELLEKRHFVVLQGAPGVGKTRMANLIGSNQIGSNQEGEITFEEVFFTQFHAETTYADFIGGIRPKLNGSGGVGYEYVEGSLTTAIKTATAEENKDKKYLLIIDEINRANLANVLGPVFYLFERDGAARKGTVKMETSSGALELSSIPDKLYVIATMNTADRSLAVVDFALRRRFAWYTLEARKIGENELDNDKYFHEDAFNQIAELFEKYASDEELNLQPGPGYFILDKKEDGKYQEEMGKRLTYEIMPLMKEYFAEGLMIKAQDEFANYYYKMTKKYMYR